MSPETERDVISKIDLLLGLVRDMDGRLSRVEARLERIEETQKSHGERLARIDGQIEGLTGRIAGIDARMGDQAAILQIAIGSRINRPSKPAVGS